MVKHADIDHSGVTGYSDFVGARVTNTAATSIANITLTAIPFAGAEKYDTSAFHDPVTNNTRLTIPSGKAGYYGIGGTVALDSASTTGNRLLAIRLNGATYIALDIRPAALLGGEQYISISTEYLFIVGDYVELIYYQSTGGAAALNAEPNYGAQFWISLRGV